MKKKNNTSRTPREVSIFDTGKYSLEDRLQASLYIIGASNILLSDAVCKHIVKGTESRTEAPVRVIPYSESKETPSLRGGKFLTLELDLTEKETHFSNLYSPDGTARTKIKYSMFPVSRTISRFPRSGFTITFTNYRISNSAGFSASRKRKLIARLIDYH